MASVVLISLGCEKNLINSEQMLRLILEGGHELVSDAADADVAVINTCGFIDSAKEEAIDTILLTAKNENIKIIVAGCLAQRYGTELTEAMTEIDGMVGTGSFDDILSAVEAVLKSEKPMLMGDINTPISETGRLVTTPRHYSYLKIADGCSNHCAFCVIPSLRGKYRSRPMENIITEAELLAASGTKELIVIAQDITRYGIDLYGKPRLPELLRALCAIDGIEWVRLHYLYPDMITDELIALIASEDKIVKYLDIPIQHVSDSILKAMNRRGTKAELETLIKKLRDQVPGVVIRTSLICGLPGEGDEEFEALCDFLREYRLERVGAFVFSPQEGTLAAEMDNRPDEETATRRAEMILDIQDRIMNERSQTLVGEALSVICDGWDEDSRCWTGRTFADSPGIDGAVYFQADGDIEPGTILTVLIEEADAGELTGRAIL